MNKTFRFFLPLVALVALLLPSCSGNEAADAGQLLATVPNDASTVVVINMKSLLEKAGCKVSDDKITPGDDLRNFIDRKVKGQYLEDIQSIFDGQTGVDPSVACFYQVGYYYYLTGNLADPAKFKEAVKKKTGASFSTEAGIDICRNIAVSNSRFWVNLEQGSIDPKEVKHFTGLDSSQSFMNNPYSEQLSNFDDDIEGWGNIKGILNTMGLSFLSRTQYEMAIQTAFEDPYALTFSLEFEKGKADVEVGVLNSKSKPAKFNLPTGKIDTDAVASIGGTTTGLVAVAVPNKLVKKLLDETKSKAPSVIGAYLEVFKGLDGTCAFSYDEQGAVNGLITTTGEDLTQLSDMLGQNGVNVNKEGNILRLTKGNVTGSAEVAALAPEFKGAMIGFAMYDPKEFDLAKDGVASVVGKLSPESGSLKMTLTLNGINDSENFLLTLIKAQ